MDNWYINLEIENIDDDLTDVIQRASVSSTKGDLEVPKSVKNESHSLHQSHTVYYFEDMRITKVSKMKITFPSLLRDFQHEYAEK
jgi:hypothetical protein